MSFSLQEAVGPDAAGRIENARQSEQLVVADDLAAAAADHVGLTQAEREQASDAARRLDDLYFELREAGDPSWEVAFCRARAASALAAARAGDIAEAAYEAKHAGLSSDDLAALVDRRL